MEKKPLRLTQHNGCSRKIGVYNPKHNDCRLDLDCKHIDAERTKRNFMGTVIVEQQLLTTAITNRCYFE